MHEVVSTSVIVQKRFSIQQMLEIYQAVKKVNGSVYFYHQQKAIDAASLTKLVSFLLTVEPNSTVKLSIEGTNVEAELERFNTLLKNEAVLHFNQRTQWMESSDTF